VSPPLPASVQQSRFASRLEVFRDRLLQIDWRNRAICLRKVHHRWAIDLAAPAVGPETATDATRKAVKGSGRVSLVLDSDMSDAAAGVRSRLTQLERTARLIAEETGVRDFYLGFPFLVGHIAADRYVRAPVLLFPVRVEHVRRERGAGWYVVVAQDDDVQVNRALFAALRKVGGLRMPADFEDRVGDLLDTLRESAEGDPVRALLAGLQRLLVEGSVPLPGAGEPPAVPFAVQEFTSEELASLPPAPLRLEWHAVAGSFPQGSTSLYRAYEDLIARAGAGEVDQGIIDDLLEAPAAQPPAAAPEWALDIDRIPDRDLNFALPTDGSQESVLVEAQSSECTVVRGPPGTGKSQVIVNLVTNALAKGERVLVVCQKRAALDVVFQRLERAGLTDASVLVHDAGADRPEQYKRLARRMAGPAPGPDERLEREFSDTAAAIDRTIGEINRLVEPLWADPFGGARPHEVYAALEPDYPSIMILPLPAERVRVPDLQGLLGKMPALEAGGRRFDTAAFPLSGRKSFARTPPPDLSAIDRALARVEAASLPEALALSPGAHEELAACGRTLLRLQGKFWAPLVPSFRRARAAVSRFLAEHAGDPRAANPQALLDSLEAGSRLRTALLDLEPWFVQAQRDALHAAAADPAALAKTVRAMRAALSEADTVTEHDRRVAALTPIETDLYRACLTALADSPGPWDRALRQEVYLGWIQSFERANPQLAGEPFARYLEMRAGLASLLDRRRALFLRRLSREVQDRVRRPVLPPGAETGRKRPETEWKKLEYEFNKRRRVKPIRRLMEEYPFQLMRIAPCWLMSPEAVADVFPLDRRFFDLVIFDEASQLAVERGLPSIYLGKRVLIAGDEMQLRPFDLFRLRDDSEEPDEEADDVVEAESLLVLSMRLFPARYLSWHYRSKYQELIDFSNHAFYDGNLQIAANVGRNARVPPIEFVRAAGRWEDRRNPIEAEKVVDVLGGLLAPGPGAVAPPTVGVVTFNEPQLQQVQDAIDARRSADPTFDALYSAADAADRLLDDRPFIKNLENVQGDERDVIIFSVGYAPGPDGRLRAQFGSLNQEGGENRLNVAVTRARRKVVLVASFDPKDLPVEGTKNPGPRRLQEYLLYAEAVSRLDKEKVARILSTLSAEGVRAPAAAPSLLFESPLEAQVAEALGRLGYTVDTQVGFSGYRIDLAVLHPRRAGEYVLGIECDGATFHSARSARERDVARQAFLEAHGWTVERVWSRNWWRDREGEVRRLQERIEHLARGPAPDREVSPTNPWWAPAQGPHRPG